MNLIFKSITIGDYRKIYKQPENIVYYINNVKNKNVFFKNNNRYNSAIRVYKDDIITKDDEIFEINKFYFNPETGLVYIYISEDIYKVVQSPWLQTVNDNVTSSVATDVLFHHHNNSQSTSNLKIHVVDKLPTGQVEVGIYLVKNNTSERDNLYDEYIYINNKWEMVYK